MNCREGDLAIIVKSYAGNEGKIVRCVRFCGEVDFSKVGRELTWEIDTYVMTDGGHSTNLMPDSFLRPIRDSDKQDEMLSIVNLKEKVKS